MARQECRRPKLAAEVPKAGPFRPGASRRQASTKASAQAFLARVRDMEPKLAGGVPRRGRVERALQRELEREGGRDGCASTRRNSPFRRWSTEMLVGAGIWGRTRRRPNRRSCPRRRCRRPPSNSLHADEEEDEARLTTQSACRRSAGDGGASPTSSRQKTGDGAVRRERELGYG